MCVNEKIELFMAMRIRLAAAEAERKGLHYVASTCCYGAGASSPQPLSPPCMAASLPASHPAFILVGPGWRAEPSTELAMVCQIMGVLLSALCLPLPWTGLEVTLNLPAFWSRIPSAIWEWWGAGGWWEGLGWAATTSHGWGWAKQV